MWFFRLKKIHLNKLPYFPQSIFQLSSTNEFKRKKALRNILLSLFEILSPTSSHKNDPQTYPFLIDSQRGIILHVRGCTTEPGRGSADSPASSLFWQIPTVATQTDDAPKPQALLSQQKCPQQACRSPVVLAAGTGPECHVVFRLDRKQVETWYSKSPSAPLARWSKRS